MKIKKIYTWKNVSVTYEKMTNVNNGCNFQMKENKFFYTCKEIDFSNVSEWLGYKCKTWVSVSYMKNLDKMGQQLSMNEWEKAADVWEQM